MKRILFLLVLLLGALGANAQEATSLQVAPSDQVKYPDASQILNKTDPAPPIKTIKPAAPPLPTTKPLLASTPVPAKVVAAKPVAASPASIPADAERGWFLRWTLTGDENAALGWVQELGLPASLRPLPDGTWEVWAGPIEPSTLKGALRGQAGLATLVRR